MEENKYLKDFKKRLEEIDIIEGVHYTVTKKLGTNICVIETIAKNWKLTAFAIFGMIFHFSNRKWITKYNYIYIMKTHIAVIFNDGSIETN